MVSWGFSLMVVVSFFGLQAYARDGRYGRHFSEELNPSAAAMASIVDSSGGTELSSTVQGTLSSGSTASPTPASTSTSHPSSIPDFFETRWSIPDFVLGQQQTGQVQYTVEHLANLDNPALFVCQTNASPGEIPNSTNTWSVSQVPGLYSSPSLSLQYN
jgi:hypothetical protein